MLSVQGSFPPHRNSECLQSWSLGLLSLAPEVINAELAARCLLHSHVYKWERLGRGRAQMVVGHLCQVPMPLCPVPHVHLPPLFLDPQGFRCLCASLQGTRLAAGKWKETEYPTPVTVPLLGPPHWPLELWP